MVGMNYAIPVYGLSAEEFVRRLDAIVLLAGQWMEKLRLMGAEQEKLAVQTMENRAEENMSDDALYASMQMLRI